MDEQNMEPRFDPETGKPLIPSQGNTDSGTYTAASGLSVSVEGQDTQTGAGYTQPADTGNNNQQPEQNSQSYAGASYSNDQNQTNAAQNGQNQYAAQPPQFDPMTGQPLSVPGNEKKKKKWILPVAIAGVIAVIAIVFGVLFASGAFMSKEQRIWTAFKNTFKSDAFIKDLSGLGDVAKTGTYSMNLNGKAGIADVNLGYDFTYAQSAKKGDQSLTGSVDISKVNIDITEYMDDSQVIVDSSLFDQPFTYVYKDGDYSGALFDNVDDETVDVINENISLVHDQIKNVNSDKLAKEYEKLISDNFKDLDFTKGKAAKYTVDGKEVNCESYSTTITSDDLNSLIDDFEELQNKEQPGYLDLMKNLYEMIGTDYSSPYDVYRDALEDMEDVDCDIYLYKKQVAAIVLTDSEDSELEICFEGGNVPWHNLSVSVDGEVQMSMTEDIDGTSQTLTMYDDDDDEVFSLEYDSKGKEYDLDVQGIRFSGAITKEKGSSGFSIKTTGFNMDVTITGDAKVEKPEGDPIDLGTATRSELAEAYESIQKTAEEIFSSIDLY